MALKINDAKEYEELVKQELAWCDHVTVDKCNCWKSGYQWQFIEGICLRCKYYQDTLFKLYPWADDDDILILNDKRFTKGKINSFRWDNGYQITQIEAKIKTWRIIKKEDL
jgi:hypothetical protein